MDREEMVEIVSNMYTSQGVAMVNIIHIVKLPTYRNKLSAVTLTLLFKSADVQETAIERANAVFEKLDVNDDGSLDEQEFVDGCMNDERLAQLLNTGSGQEHINLGEEEEEN